MDDAATLCSVATSVTMVGNPPPYEPLLSAEKFVHEPILVLTRRPDKRMYAAALTLGFRHCSIQRLPLQLETDVISVLLPTVRPKTKRSRSAGVSWSI